MLCPRYLVLQRSPTDDTATGLVYRDRECVNLIPLITPWFAVIMEIYHQLGSTVGDFSSLHSWGCLNPGKV